MAEKTKSGLGSVVRLTVTLAVSAAAGFAAGVLFAPKSGKETREDVKDMSLKLKKDANLYTNEFKNRSSQMFKAGKQQFGDDLLDFKRNLPASLPMDQVVTKVKKVGSDSKAAMENISKSMKKETRPNRTELEDSDEFSTDSLLARIQGITADSLED